MSGDCTQTDSKALRAIWCLSNSQLNSRNLKRNMRGHHARTSCDRPKNSEGWTKVRSKALTAEGGRDVRSAGGLKSDSHCDPDGQNVEAISQTSLLSKHNVRWEYLLKATLATEQMQNMMEQKISLCSRRSGLSAQKCSTILHIYCQEYESWSQQEVFTDVHEMLDLT